MKTHSQKPDWHISMTDRIMLSVFGLMICYTLLKGEHDWAGDEVIALSNFVCWGQVVIRV